MANLLNEIIIVGQFRSSSPVHLVVGFLYAKTQWPRIILHDTQPGSTSNNVWQFFTVHGEESKVEQKLFS